MRPVCALFFAASLMLPFMTSGQGREDEEKSIRKVLSAFAVSWNAADVDGFGRLFSPDADFVVITGKVLKGRAEIQSHHAALLAQQYKGSELAWTPTDVRFVRADVALAHVATEISFDAGKERRTSVALVILAKQGGQWLIESVQNTLTGGPLPTPKAR